MLMQGVSSISLDVGQLMQGVTSISVDMGLNMGQRLAQVISWIRARTQGKIQHANEAGEGLVMLCDNTGGLSSDLPENCHLYVKIAKNLTCFQKN